MAANPKSPSFLVGLYSICGLDRWVRPDRKKGRTFHWLGFESDEATWESKIRESKTRVEEQLETGEKNEGSVEIIERAKQSSPLGP